jgi:hypothetical protein
MNRGRKMIDIRNGNEEKDEEKETRMLESYHWGQLCLLNHILSRAHTWKTWPQDP